MKKICLLIIVLLLFTCVMGSASFLPAVKPITVNAYTEKQKKQVKAWLSAHGYPPTMEGAYQAYQDYLSGKLTLSEEEQELVNKNIGKTPKKKKAKSKKKSNSKSNSKKKKSSKKKGKATPTPKVQTSKEKKAANEKRVTDSPTPTVENETTPAAGEKEVESGRKCGTDDDPESELGSSWKGIIFYIGGGIILLFVVVLVCVRRKKSSR